MAVICGIHCLVTPVILVALPILATTFWVDENFHLWMLLLVIPTTTLAVWSGCRRHKDKWVLLSAATGISILVTALAVERWEHSRAHGGEHAHVHDDEHTHAHGTERISGPGDSVNETTRAAAGGCCELHPPHSEVEEGGADATRGAELLTWHAFLNTLGGCFLVAGHARNFVLCRKSDCCHDERC